MLFNRKISLNYSAQAKPKPIAYTNLVVRNRDHESIEPENAVDVDQNERNPIICHGNVPVRSDVEQIEQHCCCGREIAEYHESRVNEPGQVPIWTRLEKSRQFKSTLLTFRGIS